jgi:hypothetical protein
MSDKPTITICADTGKVLTETVEGIAMPADYSFASVNDYVHGVDRYFEELQCLALGMACEIDKLRSVAEAADKLRTFMVWHGEANTKDRAALDLFEAVLAWMPNATVRGRAALSRSSLSTDGLCHND